MNRTFTWMPWLCFLFACKPPPSQPAKPVPPAKVENRASEAAIATITLTEAAERRLGITTAPVAEHTAPRRRTLAAEARVPPGRSVSLQAPFAAIVASTTARPVPGSKVTEGQPLLALFPLHPEAQIERAVAARELASAQARLDAATARERRTRQLLADRTGSVRAVEEAEEAVRVANAELTAARLHESAWAKSGLAEDGSLGLRAPFAGIVTWCQGTPGQVVAAGTSLCAIAALDPLWIHVPVHAGELGAIADGSILVHLLSDREGLEGWQCERAPAPPAADPASATVDLVFQLSNGDGKVLPGQRLLGTVTLRDATAQRTVKRAAVLHDVHGATWVYARLQPFCYARRRVEIAFVDGDDAVLAKGPASGTEVVTAGAAELFGTEFGEGK